MLRFAERVRLVGEGQSKTGERSISSPSRRLTAGSECALRVLEIQPISWNKPILVRTVVPCLGRLTTHPDVADRLEIRLVRDGGGEESNDDLDEIERWLMRYQELRTSDVSRRFSPGGTSPFADD